MSVDVCAVSANEVDKKKKKIDDLKANKRKINLWQDQLTHVAQIGLTIWFIIFCIRLGWM